MAYALVCPLWLVVFHKNSLGCFSGMVVEGTIKFFGAVQRCSGYSALSYE